MPVQPIVRSIVRPTVTGIVRSFGSSFVSRFGAGLSAAYFLADLGSERGTVDSATNPVSRDRRDSDGGLRAFTAADIKSGTALDYVNNGTTSLYGEAMYFDGVNDYVNFGDILGIASTGFSGSLKTVFQGEQGTLLSKGGQTGGYLLYLDANGTLFLLLKQDTSSSQYRRYDSTTKVDKSILLNISFTIGALGASFSASVNGTSLSFNDTGVTGTYADTGDDFSIGSRDGGGSVLYTGVIADVNITSVLTTAGNGNTNANWADTSGNDNNGTVNGSPALYTGQMFDGLQSKFYDGLTGANDATQATVADMPKTVVAGARVVDGNGNASTLWDSTDELTFTTAFTGLTAANVYAVTDNAGTVTLDTITDFDISAITTMTALLTSLTYDKVTAVIIAPDNANQAAIQADLNRLFGI